MKHFLLASAAAIALLAAPLALAQSAPQAPAQTYSTPQTAPDYTLPQNDPAFAPAAPTTAPTTTPANPYAAPVAPRAEAAPPAAYDTPNVAEAQPSDAEPTQAAEAQAYDGGADQRVTAQTAEANASATQVGAEALPEAEISLASLQEHARDAGMEALPMSSSEVCAPRSVSFEQTRLTNDARHQLVAAVDRASVCQVREVTIKASESRAAAVRRELVAAGVDESAITVEPTSGALEVDMAFSGVAASSDQYAAMWNGGAQLASAEPNAAYGPSATDSAASQGYTPTAYTPSSADRASDISYTPAESNSEANAPRTPNPYY